MEDAPPVIKKIHKPGTAPDPIRGLFEVTIQGKPRVVEYEPDPDLRDTEQVPLARGWRDRGVPAPGGAALCCGCLV